MNHKLRQLTTAIRNTKITKKHVFIAASSLLVSGTALAFKTPAGEAPGKELYDLFVVNGLQGVPGFIGGAWLIAQAGQMMKESVWKAGLQAAGGIGLVKADAIMPTLGALIS